MSRLYYDKPATKAQLQAGRQSDTKEYLEKVAKLIPGEIIAAYITLIGLVPSIKLIPDSYRFWAYMGVFIVCLGFTFIYMDYQSEKDKPKGMHIIVSGIAFVIWAYAISGNMVWPSIHDAALASAVLVVFSLVSGKIPLS